MAKAKGQNTTTTKVRIPHTLLAAIDEWASLKGLPRSKAIQELVLRGLALWEQAQRQKAA